MLSTGARTSPGFARAASLIKGYPCPRAFVRILPQQKGDAVLTTQSVLLAQTDPFFVSQHSIPIPTHPVASNTSGVKLIAENATDSALAVAGSAVKS